MMISSHWQERRKLKFSELLMDTHHEISCHLICHPVMTWVMNRGATYAPLVIYTLNWDKRDTIYWNAATAWRHRRCPLRRQQDGHAVPTHNVQKTERRGVNAARLIECKLYKVLSIYRRFFSITVCVKRWDEGVARQQQSAPKLNAFAAVLTQILGSG